MDEQIESVIQQKVQSAVQSSQGNMLYNLDRLISEKLVQFEQKVSRNQKDISDYQISRFQSLAADQYKFKRHGNEVQHKHNSSVLQKMEEAKIILEEDDATHSKDKVISKLAEGIELTRHRLKMIKLADMSENGWKTVEEYETHQLADDSDDERKILKAESRATRKIKHDREKRFSKGRRFSPYTAPVQQTSANNSSAPTLPRRPGLCFACGKAGHWRSECFTAMNAQGAANSPKISIHDFLTLNKKRSNCTKSSERVNEETKLSPQFTIGTCLSQQNNSLVTSGVGSSKFVQDNENSVTCFSRHSTSSVCLDDFTVTKPSRLSADIDNCSDKFSERDSGFTVSNTLSPVGSLKEQLTTWKNANACQHVLEVIEKGYKLPFFHIPESVHLKNNKSALDNAVTVEQEIDALLTKHCITETQSRPTVVNPLTVAFNKSGKARLVLDCRHLNLQLFKFKFKLEDTSVAKTLFQKGDYLIKFDLKSAYHHISIFKDHRQYLGFQWPYKGINTFFVFDVLPFGISTAAYIFTKLTRVILKHWRDQGLRVLMYLDDGMAGGKSLQEASQMSRHIQKDLCSFGFLIAEEKCSWHPTLTLTWLGHVWNMELGKIYVEQSRVDKLNETLSWFCDKISKGSQWFKARRIAALVGQIISMHFAVGKTVRLRTRCLHTCIISRASWDSPVLLSIDAIDEVFFWKENLVNLNGSDLVQSVEFSEIVYTDASHGGYGGYVEGLEGSEIFGTWSKIESDKSSTWRELEALNRVCRSLVSRLEGRSVACFTDSKNVVSIVKYGSMKPDLQRAAVSISDFCKVHDVALEAKWVPREVNETADFLSRCRDNDDWGIRSNVFTFLANKWGQPDVDRFATDYNTKCKIFNSSVWCPGTAAIDAFNQSWVSVKNWLVPPPRYISKCIQKVQNEKAMAILVVPLWKSSSFWPTLMKGDHPTPIVSDWINLGKSNIVHKGRGRNGIFGQNPLSFNMGAFKLKG